MTSHAPWPPSFWPPGVFEVGHRARPHPLEGPTPQILRRIAQEQREKARHEMDSKRLLLGEIFDGLGCTGSRERFIRNFRHYHIEDIQAAQRDLARNWWCCCRVDSPDRYFAKVLWNAAIAGRNRREEERRQRAADAELWRRHQADASREAFLLQHPHQLLRRGLDLVVIQCSTEFARELLCARRGLGPATIARAVDLLRTRQPAVYLDRGPLIGRFAGPGRDLPHAALRSRGTSAWCESAAAAQPP